MENKSAFLVFLLRKVRSVFSCVKRVRAKYDLSLCYQQNITQNIKIDHITVATPAISASNSATSYEIHGASVTLSCVSTSDSDGSGTYVWKHNGKSLYVFLGYFQRYTILQKI